MSVLVVGSANMDFVFRASRLPAPGETLLGNGFASAPGGKGANQAAAIGSLDGDVHFLGCVGNDANGETVRACLENLGVHLEYLEVEPDVATGVAGIFVGEEGENSIVVYPGANSNVKAISVREAILRESPAVVLTQLEIPLDVVRACAGSHKLILNPAPFRPIPEDFFASVDIIIPNETEAEQLTGIAPSDETACESAASQLMQRGAKAVVITLGERGCFVASKTRWRAFKPPSVETIDTTAAGDAFCGALAHFVSCGKDIFDAAELGVHIAALSTTKRGAQSSLPNLIDLRNRFPSKF